MSPSYSAGDDPFVELLISKRDSGYEVRATSNNGQAQATFDSPFSPDAIQMVEQERYTAIHQPRVPAGSQYIASDTIRSTGYSLFKALIREEILGFFVASYNQATDSNRPLRLRIVFDQVPDLENLPWEYMYTPSFHMFLSVNPHTPLVRSLPALQPVRPLQAQLPLRMLIVSSAPGDAAELDTEHEADTVMTAVYPLTREKLIEAEHIHNPTLLTLTKKLSENPYHVAHVIAHGEFDPETGKSFLLFEDEFGATKKVSANQFSTALRSSTDTRLVVLNACNTAKSHDSWSGGGMCQTLLKAGVPAVVAMTDPVSNEAGKLFAQSLYESLAQAESIDVAVNRARLAVYTDRPEGLEWATPVLYMRSPSGQLFDLSAGSKGGWWKKLFS